MNRTQIGFCLLASELRRTISALCGSIENRKRCVLLTFFTILFLFDSISTDQFYSFTTTRSRIRFMDYAFWLELGRQVLRLPRTCSLLKFKVSFKLPPDLVDYLFRKLKRFYPHSRPKHFLWALYYLKTDTLGEENIAIALGTNRATLRAKLWLTLENLDSVLPEVFRSLLAPPLC